MYEIHNWDEETSTWHNRNDILKNEYWLDQLHELNEAFSFLKLNIRTTLTIQHVNRIEIYNYNVTNKNTRNSVFGKCGSFYVCGMLTVTLDDFITSP